MDNLAAEGYTTIPNLLTPDECHEFCRWIDKLFAAEPLVSGFKYILRGDIIIS